MHSIDILQYIHKFHALFINIRYSVSANILRFQRLHTSLIAPESAGFDSRYRNDSFARVGVRFGQGLMGARAFEVGAYCGLFLLFLSH